MMLNENNLKELGLSAALIRRFERADRLMKRYEDTRERAAAAIKAVLPKGTYILENITVKRSNAKVVDKARLVEAYPYEKFPEFYKPALDLGAIPAEIKADFQEVQERVSVDAA